MGVKAWITVNGNHIPIMDGESKMQAVGRFIKDRYEKNRTKRILDEHNKAQSNIDKKYGHNGPTSRHAKTGDYEKESDELASKTVSRLKERRTIRGRAKPKGEYYNEKAKEEELEAHANRRAADKLRQEGNRYASNDERSKAKFKEAYKLDEKSHKLMESSLESKYLAKTKNAVYKLKGQKFSNQDLYNNGKGKYQREYETLKQVAEHDAAPAGTSRAINAVLTRLNKNSNKKDADKQVLDTFNLYIKKHNQGYTGSYPYWYNPSTGKRYTKYN